MKIKKNSRLQGKDPHLTVKETKPYKTVYEEYRDIFLFDTCPVNKQFKDMFFKKFMKWAVEDEDAVNPGQFVVKEGVTWTTMWRWRDSDPFYQEVYTMILQTLGNRRELNGLKRKYDPGLVATSMHRYDKGWKESEEWRAQLKRDNGPGHGTISVHIENIPTTDIVPIKKEE